MAQRRLAESIATWQILTPGLEPAEYKIKSKIPTLQISKLRQLIYSFIKKFMKYKFY